MLNASERALAPSQTQAASAAIEHLRLVVGPESFEFPAPARRKTSVAKRPGFFVRLIRTSNYPGEPCGTIMWGPWKGRNVMDLTAGEVFALRLLPNLSPRDRKNLQLVYAHKKKASRD